MQARRYQLTKVRAGEWLLPSNDASGLWRLAKSTEGWELYHRPMPTSDSELDRMVELITEGDYSEWDHNGTHPSRQEAIDYAMECDSPRLARIVDGWLVP